MPSSKQRDWKPITSLVTGAAIVAVAIIAILTLVDKKDSPRGFSTVSDSAVTTTHIIDTVMPAESDAAGTYDAIVVVRFRLPINEAEMAKQIEAMQSHAKLIGVVSMEYLISSSDDRAMLITPFYKNSLRYYQAQHEE